MKMFSDDVSAGGVCVKVNLLWPSIAAVVIAAMHYGIIG